MPKPVHIAAVAPVYRGDIFVGELCRRLHNVLGVISQNYLIVLVDDGSPDAAWEFIKAESKKDTRVLGIQLSRNFGQHYAIAAGLDHVEADWTVVMDADLQDEPEDIALLYRKAISEEFDVVIAERSIRDDPPLRVTSSRLYNRVFSALSGLPLSPKHGNFRIMNRGALQAVREMREYMRFYPALMQWIGFKVGAQKTARVARASGKSAYNLLKLLRLAFHTTLAYSDRPLYICVLVGVVISAVSLAIGCAVLAQKLFYDVPVTGWTSLFTLVAFMSGLQIFLLGVVGLYVGKTFQETKGRPLYIVRNRTDLLPVRSENVEHG